MLVVFFGYLILGIYLAVFSFWAFCGGFADFIPLRFHFGRLYLHLGRIRPRWFFIAATTVAVAMRGGGVSLLSLVAVEDSQNIDHVAFCTRR